MYAKILVVDDDSNVRKVLFDLLKKEKYYVEVASDAEEALEKIKVTAFDLIISDIKMPGIGGFKLLEKIRTMNVDSAMLFITGYGSVDSAIEAIKLGVVDYIEKPFDIRKFKNLVSQILDALYIQRTIAKDKLLVYTLSRAIFGNDALHA